MNEITIDNYINYIDEIVDNMIKISDNNTKESYYIIKADDQNKIRLFVSYSILYHYVSTEKKHYVGIDFEFNEHKIALCQVAFFHSLSRNKRFIILFNPQDLTTIQTQYIIKFLFTSNYVYKLVHGSDSLDIPYIFQEFFMQNTTYIFNFVKRVIDLRFLCEYNKILANEEKKCSIYDALLYYGVINQKKYDYLVNVNQSLLVPTGVNWNINNMSDNHLIYASYDVIYLRDLYKKIKHTKYIPLITRFIYLEKWHVSDLLIKIKNKVDPLNNYIIKNKNSINDDINDNITLISVFNNLISDNIVIHVNSEDIKINDLLAINYFKTPLILLFKYVIYSILCDKYTIYKNKKDLYTKKIDIGQIFDTFKEIQLPELCKLIKGFKRVCAIALRAESSTSSIRLSLNEA